MAFHVPFEHRRRGQPIYIGFEAPPRPRKPRNWIGFSGFLLSIFSFVTAGLMSPIALLISLWGLRKKPRGFAWSGVVLSLMGTGVLATVVTSVRMAEQRRYEHRVAVAQQRENAQKLAETTQTLAAAVEEMQGYLDEHSGYFPDLITANMLTIKYNDGWGSELRFEREADVGIIRSAGADMKFDTGDDVTGQLNGKPEVLAGLLQTE